MLLTLPILKVKAVAQGTIKNANINNNHYLRLLTNAFYKSFIILSEHKTKENFISNMYAIKILMDELLKNGHSSFIVKTLFDIFFCTLFKTSPSATWT